MFVLKQMHLQRKINLSLRKDFTSLLFERSGYGNEFTKLKGSLILNNTFYMRLQYYHLPCSVKLIMSVNFINFNTLSSFVPSFIDVEHV